MTQNIQRFYQLRQQLYCFADSLELAGRLLEGGAQIIQLRHKTMPENDLLELARRLVRLMRDYPQALLIVNDYPDIAIQAGAQGVHIGQEDGNYRQILARVPPDVIVGVSVASVEEARLAADAGATYLGAGAVYTTPTKRDAEVIGLNTLKAIVTAVSIPVVAIGGVTLDTLRDVARTGVHQFAVISDINQAANISERIRQHHTLLQRISNE